MKLGDSSENEEEKEDDENQNDLGKRKSGNQQQDAAEEHDDDDEEQNYDEIEDDAKFIKLLGKQRYIDFAEFAKILSLFNPNTGIDEKIQFYFRIFDVDQDKKINKSDLEKIMRMLFGQKLKEEDMNTLTDKIFNEVIQSADKEYLDQDDVQKILWSTNIDQKCSMHFFQS